MSQSQRRTFVENVYQTPFAFYTLPKPNVPCQSCLLKNNAPKNNPKHAVKDVSGIQKEIVEHLSQGKLCSRSPFDRVEETTCT